MKFNVFTEMEYTVKSASTLILNINALRTSHQSITSEQLLIAPFIKAEELNAVTGENRLVRLAINQPGTYKITYKATVDNYIKVVDYRDHEEVPVSEFDPAVMPYLYPSRYCQSDKLYGIANSMFGHLANPFDQVIALTNWIHDHVKYLSGSTNAQTSAFDTFTEHAGVCRDFAHLGIALCRALTIPARYFTGYAYKLNPADFHACFEAYLGGEWILFDATKLVPLNGLVKIATGRDAADTALVNLFGGATFTSMIVSCELAEDGFEEMTYLNGGFKGISYL